ncbi:crossover junction endodeoxyribonuclease RuvC, partial [Phenylobacterium sp.]
MSLAPLRILGLDPGLRKTGWGMIRVEGNRLSHLGHGVIAPDEKAPFSERLLALFDGISAVVADWTPDE